MEQGNPGRPYLAGSDKCRSTAPKLKGVRLKQFKIHKKLRKIVRITLGWAKDSTSIKFKSNFGVDLIGSYLGTLEDGRSNKTLVIRMRVLLRKIPALREG